MRNLRQRPWQNAAEVIKDIFHKVPPCVVYVVILTFFNGWTTTARFQENDRVCRLCYDCNGDDRLEHYATCRFQWLVFGRLFKKSIFPMSLARFLGLYAEDVDLRCFHAVHMCAVYTAVNERRHSERITGEDEIHNLIGHGHKVAQTYGGNLKNRYRRAR